MTVAAKSGQVSVCIKMSCLTSQECILARCGGRGERNGMYTVLYPCQRILSGLENKDSVWCHRVCCTSMHLLRADCRSDSTRGPANSCVKVQVRGWLCLR
jgi:hypothetical protein